MSNLFGRVADLWDIYTNDSDLINNKPWSFYGLDSLDRVEFVFDLEDEFGITITDDEEESIRNMTLDQVTELVAWKIQEKKG
jgi:acyl carrier protein